MRDGDADGGAIHAWQPAARQTMFQFHHITHAASRAKCKIFNSIQYN
jgi:hypothetical protein